MFEREVSIGPLMIAVASAAVVVFAIVSLLVIQARREDQAADPYQRNIENARLSSECMARGGQPVNRDERVDCIEPPSASSDGFLKTVSSALFWFGAFTIWLGLIWLIGMLLKRPGLSRPIALMILGLLILSIASALYTVSTQEEGFTMPVFESGEGQ